MKKLYNTRTLAFLILAAIAIGTFLLEYQASSSLTKALGLMLVVPSPFAIIFLFVKLAIELGSEK